MTNRETDNDQGTDRYTLTPKGERYLEARDLARASDAADPSPLSREQAARVGRYVAGSLAAATRRAYRSDLKHFAAWRREHPGLDDPPHRFSPETIAAYLAALADSGKKVATVQRRLAAIAHACAALNPGEPNPAHHPGVQATLQGILRAHGAPPTRKHALSLDEVAKMTQAMIGRDEDGYSSVRAYHRDSAVALLGFFAGMRRSEIAALNIGDVHSARGGMIVTIRRSKTDQRGEGRTVGVPRRPDLRQLCPVHALERWVQQVHDAPDTPLFRSIRRGVITRERMPAAQVAQILKRAAAAAGIDPRTVAGHSLRAGFVTAALQDGANLLDVMRQTGHRSVATLQRYERNATVWTNNAAAKIGAAKKESDGGEE